MPGWEGGRRSGTAGGPGSVVAFHSPWSTGVSLVRGARTVEITSGTALPRTRTTATTAWPASGAAALGSTHLKCRYRMSCRPGIMDRWMISGAGDAAPLCLGMSRGCSATEKAESALLSAPPVARRITTPACASTEQTTNVRVTAPTRTGQRTKRPLTRSSG